MYFLFGPRSVQRTLGNNLSSQNLLGLHVGDLVALGETTSTKHFSLAVFLDHKLSIGLCDFLLDYAGLRGSLLLLGPGLFILVHRLF